MKTKFRFQLFAVLLGLAWFTSAASAVERQILETGYVDGLGKVTLQLGFQAGEDEQTSRVRFVHDPNHCNLDEFGEPSQCTKAGFRVIDTSFTDAKLSVDQSMTVYRIKDVPGFRVRLDQSESPESCAPAGRLLKIEDGAVTASYPLFQR